jgi:tripartite-type tricarboxylate transporter receptor subunit TctC
MDRTSRPQGAHAIPRRRTLGGGLAAAGLAAAAGGASAQQATTPTAPPQWPSQPVRYINLFVPGGSTDILGRIWCAKMSELTGQQFVVEARSGAGGTVGQAAIARAAPDGYTIGLGSVATLAIAPSLYPSIPFDPARDFTFVSGLFQLPNLLVVNNDLPARSVPELIDLLKRNPGRYAFGSGGSGTTVHLSGEMFKQMAGVEMIHVPYRGEAAALVDMLGGRVQMVFGNIPSAIAQVREGKARPLAVTGAQRSPVAPEIPTMTEFLPGFEITSWGALVGPAGLPRTVQERLGAFTHRALADPALARSFQDNGATTWPTTPEQFAAYRAEQEARFAQLIRASGARAD